MRRNDPDHTVTIARMVHYVSYGSVGGKYTSTCRTALITELIPGSDTAVSLAVLNPTGLFFDRALEHGFEGGHWHWYDECTSGQE